MTSYLFYFLSFVAVLSALLIVFSTNPVKSVLYLIVTFFAIAGHYVLLNAQFLAAVHVIVYAGAIMVLFLFVLMFLNLNDEKEPTKPKWLKFSAAIAAGMLLVVMTGMLKKVELSTSSADVSSNIGLIENLGTTLFKDYMLPFEVAALLFLIAMVGTVLLAKKETNSTN